MKPKCDKTKRLYCDIKSVKSQRENFQSSKSKVTSVQEILNKIIREFLAETLQVIRHIWDDIFKMIKQGTHLRILYQAQLSSKYKREIKTFLGK